MPIQYIATAFSNAIAPMNILPLKQTTTTTTAEANEAREVLVLRVSNRICVPCSNRQPTRDPARGDRALSRQEILR
jgi:hypothetical protein